MTASTDANPGDAAADRTAPALAGVARGRRDAAATAEAGTALAPVRMPVSEPRSTGATEVDRAMMAFIAADYGPTCPRRAGAGRRRALFARGLLAAEASVRADLVDLIDVFLLTNAMGVGAPELRVTSVAPVVVDAAAARWLPLVLREATRAVAAGGGGERACARLAAVAASGRVAVTVLGMESAGIRGLPADRSLTRLSRMCALLGWSLEATGHDGGVLIGVALPPARRPTARARAASVTAADRLDRAISRGRALSHGLFHGDAGGSPASRP